MRVWVITALAFRRGARALSGYPSRACTSAAELLRKRPRMLDVDWYSELASKLVSLIRILSGRIEVLRESHSRDLRHLPSAVPGDNPWQQEGDKRRQTGTQHGNSVSCNVQRATRYKQIKRETEVNEGTIVRKVLTDHSVSGKLRVSRAFLDSISLTLSLSFSLSNGYRGASATRNS